MLFSTTTLALLVAALAPFTAAQGAGKGDIVSKPDHSDYGNQGGHWHWWDKEHLWKPVSCKTTANCKAEAQKGQNPYKRCPFPLTKDTKYLDVDLGVQYGGTACLPAPEGKGKSCYCGAGLSGNTADLKQFCTAYLKAAGLKDVSVKSACVFGKPEDKDYAWNCMVQCGPKNKKCIQEVGIDSCKKTDKACIQKAGSMPFPLVPKKLAPSCK